MERSVKRIALTLLIGSTLTACGEDNDIRTHQGYVEYQCRSEQERLEVAGIRPEFRPKYERLVAELCDDLRRSQSREEAVRIIQEANTRSWYPPEEYPDGPWSGQ